MNMYKINDKSTTYLFESAYYPNNRPKLGCIVSYALNPVLKRYPLARHMPVVDVPLFF